MSGSFNREMWHCVIRQSTSTRVSALTFVSYVESRRTVHYACVLRAIMRTAQCLTGAEEPICWTEHQPLLQCPPSHHRLLVMPEQRPEVVPVVGIAVEVRHRVEHAGLDCLSTLLEEPHHRAPDDGCEDGELASVWWQRPSRRRRSIRIRRLGPREERGDDARADVQDDL